MRRQVLLDRIVSRAAPAAHSLRAWLWGWFICRVAPAAYSFGVTAWREAVPVGLSLWGWFICRAAPAAYSLGASASDRLAPRFRQLWGRLVCRAAPAAYSFLVSVWRRLVRLGLASKGWLVCRAAPAVHSRVSSAWCRLVPLGVALKGWLVCRAAPAVYSLAVSARGRLVPWRRWLAGWFICRLAPWAFHAFGRLRRNLNGVSFWPRIPRGAKSFGAGAVALASILGVGFAIGHSTGPTDEPLVQQQQQQHAAAPAPQLPQAQPPPPPPPPPPTPDTISIPAQLAPPQQVPLAWRNPVVGPDRPPLPEEDADGPYGSRRTTGTYEVALTFDDGPDPQWTPRVLESLRENQIKATFCLIGVNVVEFPELVRDIAADGHTLCNHSWAHDTGLGTRSYSTILADMSRTNEAIQAAVPRARVSYFRHPGGMWTAAAVAAAKSLGMTSLHWDVDPKDWLRPGARAISSTVIASAIPGAIVLLHDGGGDRRGTTEALSSILPNLRSRFPLVALPAGIDPPRRHGIQLPTTWDSSRCLFVEGVNDDVGETFVLGVVIREG